MILYTAQLSKFKGQAGIDTTVKSAKGDNVLFAPIPLNGKNKWDMVMGHKSGKLSDEDYTKQYLEILRYNFEQSPSVFLDLFNREIVVLQCYCRGDGRFCHRHLLRDFILDLADEYNKECVFGGEITHLPDPVEIEKEFPFQKSLF